MRFENLSYAGIFLILPLLLIFYFWSEKRRVKTLQKFSDILLLNKIVRNFDHKLEKLRRGLLFTGLFLIICALLGPQWGYKWETITHRGVDIIIALDTSRSMLAEDVKPNRLDKSKLIIKDLIENLDGDRLGLITFAGTGFLQVPLTVDYSAFMEGLEMLHPDIMPQGGTAIGGAMEIAIKAFQNASAENKVLILITDGENHLGDPIGMAKKLKEFNIQLLIFGMGSIEGDLIPIMIDGQRQYLKDQKGNVVKTSLNEELLTQIASVAKGVYLQGNNFHDFNTVYNSFVGEIKQNEYSNIRRKQYHQRYQIFLLIGMLLICAEMFIGIKRGVKW